MASSLALMLDSTPESAERIWAEFFPRLIRLARKKLDDLPKRIFDEEDVALSALNSFFRGREGGRFDRLTNRDEMWRLLATITVRKATAQRRRLMAGKRGGGRMEFGESVFLRPGMDGDGSINGLAAMQDDNLLPETTDEILKTCGELLEKLGDEKLRSTAVLRLQGFSNEEIANQLGCSVARTKQRLQRIREIWADDASGGEN